MTLSLNLPEERKKFLKNKILKIYKIRTAQDFEKKKF